MPEVWLLVMLYGVGFGWWSFWLPLRLRLFSLACVGWLLACWLLIGASGWGCGWGAAAVLVLCWFSVIWRCARYVVCLTAIADCRFLVCCLVTYFVVLVLLLCADGGVLCLYVLFAGIALMFCWGLILWFLVICVVCTAVWCGLVISLLSGVCCGIILFGFAGLVVCLFGGVSVDLSVAGLDVGEFGCAMGFWFGSCRLAVLCSSLLLISRSGFVLVLWVCVLIRCGVGVGYGCFCRLGAFCVFSSM